jgi:hypothetical protein
MKFELENKNNRHPQNEKARTSLTGDGASKKLLTYAPKSISNKRDGSSVDAVLVRNSVMEGNK